MSNVEPLRRQKNGTFANGNRGGPGRPKVDRVFDDDDFDPEFAKLPKLGERGWADAWLRYHGLSDIADNYKRRIKDAGLEDETDHENDESETDYRGNEPPECEGD